MGAARNHPPVLDWSLLLNRLRSRARIPLAQFCKAVGCDWWTLNRLARGETRDPSFSVGVRILDVAADHLLVDDWREIGLNE